MFLLRHPAALTVTLAVVAMGCGTSPATTSAQVAANSPDCAATCSDIGTTGDAAPDVVGETDAADSAADAPDATVDSDTCIGVCAPGKCLDDCGNPCAAPQKCDDGNPCTVDDACKDGTCAAGKAKDCVAPDACVTAKCSPVDGQCKFANAADGTTCDDSSLCTTADSCSAGTCGGVKLDCDDKNVCTADVCDPKTGCVHQNLTVACDDGNGCTLGDACSGGSCLAGKAKDCNDTNACTKDTCDVKTGACANDGATLDGIACDADGSACTVGDVCKAGTCAPGTKLNCDDGNPCTSDSCDLKLGCQNATLSGSACNADDNACTADTCVGAKCTAGADKSCSDGNACTVDSCDTKTGLCAFKAVADGLACDADGSKCTDKDACAAGTCTPGAVVNCDDGNLCTDDSCDASAGCVHAPNLSPCDADGNACTAGDACSNSTCKAGAPVSCGDGNPCTDDACDQKTGKCSNTANTAACTDGDPCTSDKCSGGTCVGTPKACDPCLDLGGSIKEVNSKVKICGMKIGESQMKNYKIYDGWHVCTVDDLLASTGGSEQNYDPLWTSTSCNASSGYPGHKAFGGWSGVWGFLKFNSPDSYTCSSDVCCGYGALQVLVCKP